MISQFEMSLISACRSKGFTIKTLGTLRGPDGAYPMWFVQTYDDSFDYLSPKALIVAGFHGEEQAGPWSILRWIQSCTPDTFKGVGISLIPVVNMYGFLSNKRGGISDLPTNAGFYRSGEPASPEGEILKKNIGLLLPTAKNGYLSLHEDITSSEFYFYTFEDTEKPGKFTAEIKAELKRHFPKAFNGVAYVDTGSPGKGPPCEDGLVYKFHDGTFDDWLYQLGVKRVAVTETPGEYPFMERIDASVDIINKFIDLVSQGV